MPARLPLSPRSAGGVLLIAVVACATENELQKEDALDIVVACRTELEARRRCQLEAGMTLSPWSNCDVQWLTAEQYYCKAEIYDETDCTSALTLSAAAQRYRDGDCPRTHEVFPAP